jgi:hypothetical protein
MGCEVINGFMSLLKEKINKGGKNKFYLHQFFHIFLDEKISRFNKGEQPKLTQYVNNISIKD